jgi:hypothetical protein
VSDWSEFEPCLRDRAYRRIDAMPELLLETDSWFTLDADLFYARLMGYEDEIVKDGLQLTKVVPDIRVPIYQRLTLAPFDPLDPAAIEIRTARYVLQSCFATLSVSAMHNPPVEKLRDDFTAKVAFLRYRRRS